VCTCRSDRSSFCSASTVPLVFSFTTALFLICKGNVVEEEAMNQNTLGRFRWHP
jgi:hypothetical protein